MQFCDILTMNVVWIFMWIYLAATTLLKLFMMDGSYRYLQNVQISDIIDIKTQPTMTQNYRYCRDQLLKIGLTVSSDRQLNKLDHCVHGVIHKLNIDQPKTHKRSKRGGKAKILTKPSGANLRNLNYPSMQNTRVQIGEKVSCLTL